LNLKTDFTVGFYINFFQWSRRYHDKHPYRSEWFLDLRKQRSNGSRYKWWASRSVKSQSILHSNTFISNTHMTSETVKVIYEYFIVKIK